MAAKVPVSHHWPWFRLFVSLATEPAAVMSPRLAALISVGLVSAVPLIVITLLPRGDAPLRRSVRYLVSFAAGAMLGGAFIHLIPEAFARVPVALVPPLLLLGFLGFFALETFLWVHDHRRRAGVLAAMHPVAVLNVVGDAVHNLVDGMVIAAAYLTDPALGVATTLAVILHEVPQELGDYGVLLFGGLTIRRAVLFNLLSALAAVGGALLVLVIGEHTMRLTSALLPIAAGNFIYVAAADLVPELRRERDRWTSARQLLVVIAGILVMWLPALLPHDSLAAT